MKIKQCLYIYIYLYIFYIFSQLQQPQIKDYIVPWFLVKMLKIVLFTFLQKRKKKTKNSPMYTSPLCWSRNDVGYEGSGVQESDWLGEFDKSSDVCSSANCGYCRETNQHGVGVGASQVPDKQINNLHV